MNSIQDLISTGKLRKSETSGRAGGLPIIVKMSMTRVPINSELLHAPALLVRLNSI